MRVKKEVSFAVKAPNWLGDAILAIPAIRALVDCSRRGRVVILASITSAEIFSRIPGTLVFAVSKPGGDVFDSMRAIYRGASVLRVFGPVLAFSFTRSLTSAAICLLGGVRRRVGFADAVFSFLYTDRISASAGLGKHMVESYCSLVEGVGVRVRDRVPTLEATEEDTRRGRKLLDGLGLVEGRYVCIFPGASYGPAKRWSPSRFALLGDAIVDKLDVKIVLLGTGGDADACKAVEEAMINRSLNLCTKLDFSTLVGLLKLASAAVSNDSGGMHLAAALGVPVVGLFFSTDPEWTGPLSPRSRALYNQMACSPCFARDCSQGSVCTQSIKADQVMETLGEILGTEV